MLLGLFTGISEKGSFAAVLAAVRCHFQHLGYVG